MHKMHFMAFHSVFIQNAFIVFHKRVIGVSNFQTKTIRDHPELLNISNAKKYVGFVC